MNTNIHVTDGSEGKTEALRNNNNDYYSNISIANEMETNVCYDHSVLLFLSISVSFFNGIRSLLLSLKPFLMGFHSNSIPAF